MGYRVELLVPDESGEDRLCTPDDSRHSILVHAWTAGMEAARVEADRLGSSVILRVLDAAGRIAVTGRVDLPEIPPSHSTPAR